MAFSHWAYLNQSSSGAPRNSGTNGDLTALLQWALVTNSNWSSVYDDGLSPVKKRIWQPNGGGPVFMCNHDNAVSGGATLALVRMAESQSGGTLTDPFPTVVQNADGTSNWMPSSAASTTTRDFHIVVWETGLIYASRASGTANTWEIGYLAKCDSRYGAADSTYSWMIGNRNINTTAFTMLGQAGNPVPTIAVQRNFAMRNVLGTIKSEYCVPDYPLTTGGSGSFTGMPGATSVPDAAFERKKFLFHAAGTASGTTGALASIDRFCVPFLWWLPTSTLVGFGETDVYTDASGATFVLLKSGTNGMLLQTSNDWTGYPGG
jgi:hypothetical protein